jgi:hypothetical protein
VDSLHSGPSRGLLSAALLAGALLTGCGSDEPPSTPPPVHVPVPAVDDGQRRACTSLAGALPQEIDPGVRRRAVSGDSTLTAAWGDPPVILTCGVAPADEAQELLSVNGLEWSVQDTGGAVRWTTQGLPVAVAVEVPDHYANGAELVNPLAAPILRTLGPPVGPSSPG